MKLYFVVNKAVRNMMKLSIKRNFQKFTGMTHYVKV